MNNEIFPFECEKFWEDDNGHHNGWKVLTEFFDSEGKKSEGKKLIDELKERYNNKEEVFPSQKDIFKAFELTPFENVKVVILGQDPYPDERADGLCFSQSIYSNKNDSIKRIFNVLNIKDNNKQLDGWAKQGVLLLNAILTVGRGDSRKVRDNAASHKKLGWKELTKRVICSLLENNKDIFFILLGKHAVELFNSAVSQINICKSEEQSKASCYKQYVLTNNNQAKFFIVESPHPVSSLFIKYGSPFDKFDLKKYKFEPRKIINWTQHHISD